MDDTSYPEPDLRLVGAEHIAQYEATGGRVGHDWINTQCLIARTIGRRSGRLIKRALIYAPLGDAFVVVGSKAGADTNPEWYRNMCAVPDIVVQVRNELIPVRARTSVGAERAELWARMTREFPNYQRYQELTDREIPVVVLERR